MAKTEILEKLMVRLSEDTHLMDSYYENPKAVMRGAGVPEQQVEAVLSGDVATLKNLFGEKSSFVTIIKLPKDDC